MLKKTQELRDTFMALKCQALVRTLNERHFTAVYCPTAKDAATYILKEAKDAKTVGFGGSLSVAGLLLEEPLAKAGKTLLNHGRPDLTPEQKRETMRAELTCDLFLTGTNAVTTDGCLVNIDGNGNRVAAMIFGPAKVIVVAGRNKIVDGDVNDAYLRVKNIAAPMNAMRLGKATPCAKTGFCADCDSPQRICHATTIIDSKPGATDLRVLVVNEDMGL
jgi:hypothetical protein